MDHCWILKDRRSKDYENGVECFISFSVQNSTSKISIRCPCLQCGKMIFHTPQIVREHLFFYGFYQSYLTWYWHGEEGLSSGLTTIRAEHCTKNQFSDNVDCTIEMVKATFDEFLADLEFYKKLLNDAEKSLYPSCRKFTKLYALVKLYNLKARYGWSDKGFA